MEIVTINLPTMYGDHHVMEVRRILLATPGVIDVYASSAFQVVEVSFDRSVINDLQIAVILDEAGYLGEWTPTAEAGVPAAKQNGNNQANRHTEIFSQTRQTVSFRQEVQKLTYTGRPLWPCPGMGAIQAMKDEEE
jgi:copper chaperone CopZ